MEKDVVKSWYDPEVDILYFVLTAGKIFDAEEIQDGIILEYNNNHEIIGIEIHRARTRIAEVMGVSIAQHITKKVHATEVSQTG